MVSIKVCGITDLSNANQILEVGVNALGFILADSPRQISINKAKEIINNIPPFISTVAVTVNPDFEQFNNIVNSHLFDYIQFHGEEDPNLIKKSPLKNIKAISISSKKDLEEIYIYNKYSSIDYFLFDNKSDSKIGGTGKSFSWDLIKNLSINKPIILAGGLGPQNIVEAIKKVKPEAIDLNSCLEKKPGIKDVNLYKKVVEIIKDQNLH